MCATADDSCSKLGKTNIRFIIHSKSEVRALGLVRLQVHRKSTYRKMYFAIVFANVVPLWSLQSCLDLDLIQINECDAINAVMTRTDKQKLDNGNDSHQSWKQRRVAGTAKV